MNVVPESFYPDLRPTFSHVSVLLGETIAGIAPHQNGVYLDVTVGGGGHSKALLEQAEGARLLAIDRDPRAVSAARERLAPFGERVSVLQRTISQVEELVLAMGIDGLDGIIADLGISSPQIDDPTRGMSFRAEGPLDMRMDPSGDETALELIERLSSDELANVIYEFGEERRSRRIARCVYQALHAGELHTTLDLRRAVVRAVGPARIGGVDPATKTFQALRIAVNRELDELTALLDLAPRILKAGGTLAIISFHSLEDRLVKRAFLHKEVWSRLTNKPIVPAQSEMDENPRSRSAKLRVARRILE